MATVLSSDTLESPALSRIVVASAYHIWWGYIGNNPDYNRNTVRNIIMKKSTYLFVYGTLMRGFGLHNLLEGRAEFIDEAVTVDKFTFYASGIPFMVEKPTHHVYGELYRVEKGIFKILDEIEEGYQRKQIKVKTLNTGEEFSAFAYIYPHPLPDHYVVRSGNYKNST